MHCRMFKGLTVKNTQAGADRERGAAVQQCEPLTEQQLRQPAASSSSDRSAHLPLHVTDATDQACSVQHEGHLTWVSCFGSCASGGMMTNLTGNGDKVHLRMQWGGNYAGKALSCHRLMTCHESMNPALAKDPCQGLLPRIGSPKMDWACRRACG